MPGRQTVLIIENDQPTSRLYGRVLQTEYEVALATLDDDVLSLIKASQVDAVVLEPGSIGGRGWSLLSELKNSPDLPAIPIVLCTTQDERRRGLELARRPTWSNPFCRQHCWPLCTVSRSPYRGQPEMETGQASASRYLASR